MIIIASAVGPHTGYGVILLALAAPLSAFFVFRNSHSIYRIGVALIAHALAFSGAIHLGAIRRDMMIYDLVEILRFDPPRLAEDLRDVVEIYAAAGILLVLPAFCAVAIIVWPKVTRRYLHVLPLLVFVPLLSFVTFGAITDWHKMIFLEGLSMAFSFGIVWALMRYSPIGKKAEPDANGTRISIPFGSFRGVLRGDTFGGVW